tara:strand:+ start:1955 stop:2263 length:309 start_codon:yes stop_codon:yes gene_type:complete
MFKPVSFIKKVSHRVLTTVLLKDLAEIFGILLRESLLGRSLSFFKKNSLMNGFLSNPYARTQRHTLGMWSLPLLNDELGRNPSISVCVSECFINNNNEGKEL